jgi:hypothetical protein
VLFRSHCYDTLLRYAVTLQVCVPTLKMRHVPTDQSALTC